MDGIDLAVAPAPPVIGLEIGVVVSAIVAALVIVFGVFTALSAKLFRWE